MGERRLTDILRSEQARRRREDAVASQVLPEEFLAPPADNRRASDQDDTLVLLFMCCHPALSPASQVALTLRAVGGLTTAEIARAFLVPETTMAQRISRGKQRIKTSGIPFRLPPSADFLIASPSCCMSCIWSSTRATQPPRAGRYSEPTCLRRRSGSREPFRRFCRRNPRPLACLHSCLTDARRAARTRPDGSLVQLAEQDRSRWNQGQINEGIHFVEVALAEGPPGPYVLQAAIAAVHDQAEHYDDTDWPQILHYYELLETVSANPVVTLNHAVAVAMVHGPQAGLAMVADLEADGRLAGQHRLDAVRGHLLEMAGDAGAAAEAYLAAARLTTSIPERRYLETRAARVNDGGDR